MMVGVVVRNRGWIEGVEDVLLGEELNGVLIH